MKLSRFITKKSVASMLGVAACLVTAGVFPPATAAVVVKCVALITAAYNVGQGFADGMSRGETSAHTPLDPEN